MQVENTKKTLIKQNFMLRNNHILLSNRNLYKNLSSHIQEQQ